MTTLASFHTNKVHFKNFGILLIICLLAYWPITFGIFSSKGDSLQYFLPTRYAISTAIQSGEFPFWSPWFYLGHPIYGDMQSGSWNPLVLFLSLFGKYNITTFHIEYLIYIFWGGIGMYRLAIYISKGQSAGLLIAASYILGGVMLSGQVITWAASAAIIPHIFLSYLTTKRTGNFKPAIVTGIHLWLLLVCGYPSLFIFTCYILIGLFLISIWDQIRHSKEKKNVPIQKYLLSHFLILVTFLLLSLPTIISFIDFLPYYSRGNGVTFFESLANTFEPQHFLSFFFPSEIGAPLHYSETDMTSRNIYLGIYVLPILFAYKPTLHRRNLLLSILFVFSFLFSMGSFTPVRRIAYELFPLMNTFRHPAIIKTFGMLALLLLIVPGIDSLENDLKNRNQITQFKKFKLYSLILSGFFLISAIWSFSKTNLLKNIFLNFQDGKDAIKNVIDKYTFMDAVFFNSLFQLILLTVFLYWIYSKKLNTTTFKTIWILNLFIFAQLTLPITFVSSYSASQINSFIKKNGEKYSEKEQSLTLQENSADIENIYDRGEFPLGSPNFYKKTVAISHVLYNPASFTSLDSFINNKTLYKFISSYPLIYFSDTVIKKKDTSTTLFKNKKRIIISDELQELPQPKLATAKLIKLTSNSIVIETESDKDSYLSLTQNYYPYWIATIDGKENTIYKTNFTFMSTLVPAGKHLVKFNFFPINTIICIWISIGYIIILLGLIVYNYFKK
ncbi:MAG TPA: YfhO family protein [Chitinophagaceae bacterium]|jgi:hypothetical protein|nr:YfhO family protein [Chitinophagaceae bacterium]